jgi:glucosamine--fructose-6-phosphate aminotransferase (isomerizing)
MCGIVGAIAQRDVIPILLEGLKRLEYRGYDSAGIAVINGTDLQRVRRAGKVSELESALEDAILNGRVGIAHTRWATHGAPSEANAHPHLSSDRIAVVHNGIIENYEELRNKQLQTGFEFTSATDTEVIAHQISYYLRDTPDLLTAVTRSLHDLKGAYAIGVIDLCDPQRLIAARKGSPLVIGIGIGENFLASDIQALLPVTQQFVYLENGDIADMRHNTVDFYDVDGHAVTRVEKQISIGMDAGRRGNYRHYMLKEIYEQPQAVTDTLEGRLQDGSVPDEILGHKVEILDSVRFIQIVACGTSFHAGLIAKYWFEELAEVPCEVEIASEYRYRRHVIQPGTLIVTISQSGETADTLAALQLAKQKGYCASLTICNVPESSIVRESDLILMTRAGAEIGVASTKAFTTQLVALMLLVLIIGRRHKLSENTERTIITQLRSLAGQIEHVLALDAQIAAWSERYVNKHHALFLGRGSHYPVAMEGALKLKEISYIHAEAYAAGELKHGPLALVDGDMPVIAVAPNNELLEKLKSNLEEVRSRGGELYVFADVNTGINQAENVHVLNVAPTEDVIAPIVFTVPLQLLAYHTAVFKGTDIDQPRNLAKSVTVE